MDRVRKPNISEIPVFCVFVSPSACNNSRTVERMFIGSYIWKFHWNLLTGFNLDENGTEVTNNLMKFLRAYRGQLICSSPNICSSEKCSYKSCREKWTNIIHVRYGFPSCHPVSEIYPSIHLFINLFLLLPLGEYSIRETIRFASVS
jgi:hypothetical protein